MNKQVEARKIGKQIEQKMMRMFKGKHNIHDEIDFETKKYLYEVKSCKLLVSGTNSSNKKDPTYKNCESHKLGRFRIKTDNHIMLYLRAIQQNKTPKYVFVIRIGNQTIFKTLPWEEIKITNKEKHNIRIQDVFKEKLGEAC